MAEQLAWQAELDGLCGGCGEPRDEAWHPDAEGTYEARILRCHSCTARATKGQGFDSQANAQRQGLMVVSEPTTETPRGIGA